MLNTYNDNSKHSVVMNAPCVGTLQKTHSKSKFKRFHVHSHMADWVFSDIPHLDKDNKMEIVVLQLMCFGDNELIIEYVEKKKIGRTNYDKENQLVKE